MKYLFYSAQNPQLHNYTFKSNILLLNLCDCCSTATERLLSYQKYFCTVVFYLNVCATFRGHSLLRLLFTKLTRGRVVAETPGKHSPIKPHNTKKDQEATRQQRSRSDWIEHHFEKMFFRQNEAEIETLNKLNSACSYLTVYLPFISFGGAIAP